MNALQEYYESNRLSVENILKHVDDYSIYCYYLGFEPELYCKYSSPLRPGDDTDPSFSMYESKYKAGLIMFKDSATGKYGGVFKFLMYLFDTDLKSVMMQVNKNFGIGLNGEAELEEAFRPKIVKHMKVVKTPTKIQVTTREPSKEFLDYWGRLDIGKEVRDMYHARDTVAIHFKNSDFKSVITPKSLCISYEILGHYKTYQPFAERKYKFRNDFPHGYVEGARQLKFEKDFALITKATKECMFFRQHFDWDSVAGTSENSMISEHFMINYLKNKYKRVYILLDDDEAGHKATQRYLDKYPWLIPVKFNYVFKQKDVTDEYSEARHFGQKREVLKQLKTLIY